MKNLTNIRHLLSQKVIIIILAVLLVISAGYIVGTEYKQGQVQQQLVIYQKGMQAGYEQAVIQLVQQALTCQQVPIRVQNQTINIIAVECLQQAQADEK
jgi:Tfp pilus assembly protein PilO